MSLFGGGGGTHTEEARVGQLTINQSAYGVAIPRLWGTCRVSSNLLWYGDFTAIPHTETQSSGGKGGGVESSNTTYTYKAAFMLALCSGVVSSVPRAWVDKSQYVPSKLGFELHTGSLGQSVWGHLTSKHPSEAISYSGIAYMAASAFDLGNSTSSPNMTFEVVGERAGSNGDAPAADVISDILTDAVEGIGFPSALLGDLTDYRLWCQEMNLTVSLETTEQKASREYLQEVADATLSAFVWSPGKLRIVPYGDEAVGAWSPNTIPVYALGEGDVLSVPEVTRAQTSEATNRITLTYKDRSQQYREIPVTKDDLAAVTQFGARPESITLTCIKRADMAATVAEFKLSRSLYIRNKLKVTVDDRFMLVEPMDLITLDFSLLGLASFTCRVVEVEDAENGDITLSLEEWPFGVAKPAQIQAPAGLGYVPQWNSAPANALPPTIFEPPVELTTNGLEVWVATGGVDSDWGGASIWVSYDASSYQKIGKVTGAARMGALASAMASGDLTADVQLSSGGDLLPGSNIDAAQLATLCWVGDETGGEFFAHQGAALTATKRYTLSGLIRGAYDSPVTAHAAGKQFVRIDGAIGKSGPLDLSMVGKIIYIKLTSWNRFGGAEQSLADVEAYAYRVTGSMLSLPPDSPDDFRVSAQSDGTRNLTWAWVANTKPVDLGGYRVRYKVGATSDWSSMLPLHDGLLTSSPYETNALAAGTYTFAIAAVDTMGNVSAAPTFAGATLLDPRMASVIVAAEAGSLGWPGAKTSCSVDTISGYLVADDSGTTWDSLTTWDAWARWNLNPVASIVYQHSDFDLGAVVPVTPYVTVDASGTITIEEQHSSNGSTWTGWATAGALITARYVRTRVTVASSAGNISVIRSMSIRMDGKAVRELINDLATSGAATRYAAGDIRIPLTKTYAAIRSVQVSLQSVGAGWSWEVVDRSTTGPRIRIYNASNVLADALIDVVIEGV